jgi:hypothetical protein
MRFFGYDAESLGKRSGLETSKTNYPARGRPISEEDLVIIPLGKLKNTLLSYFQQSVTCIRSIVAHILFVI